MGEHLTFLFENHDTVLYQVHEMMRAERMVHDDAIQHELDTYNGLLPSSPGALAVVLLVEYATAEEREEHLPNLLTLNEHLEIQVGDQPPVSPTVGRDASRRHAHLLRAVPAILGRRTRRGRHRRLPRRFVAGASLRGTPVGMKLCSTTRARHILADDRN